MNPPLVKFVVLIVIDDWQFSIKALLSLSI